MQSNPKSHPQYRVSRNRSAFTLVELLVVIAIIGVLVALLLPAIQAAREAARRASCSNNLKQLGLAIQNYHDTQRVLPPGGITLGPCCGTRSLTNWAIAILPFMEQQNLYDRYNQARFNEDSVNRFVRERIVETHNCPSDNNAGKLMRPESGPGSGLNYRMSSYRCMAGASNGRGWWDNEQWTNIGRPEWKGAFHAVGRRGLTSERLATITDGTSNTIAIGEMHTRTRPRRGTFWAYTYTSYNSSDAHAQSRTLLGDYNRCVAIGGPGGSNACKRGWGSFHAGGTILFAMCDGSVQMFNRNINTNIWHALATIQNGETVSLP